ncbi:MAG: protein-L-isoaspartate(D-aspartate) O-methyltransferase [Pseudomonadota bacterium]
MHPNLERMIEDIRFETLESRNFTGVSVIAPQIIDALRQTPREAFVTAGFEGNAYANRPLPLCHGQTISQPFIVALMTQLLMPRPDHTILEVGTGSGYQAAVLARLVRHVVSIEIIAELAKRATELLRSQQVNNVEIHHGDGYLGWPESAPYDGIIVTACAPAVPPPLIDQLKPGGRMIIPIGQAHAYQELRLVEKSEDGAVTARNVLPVAFVPFTRA